MDALLMRAKREEGVGDGKRRKAERERKRRGIMLADFLSNEGAELTQRSFVCMRRGRV